MSTPYTIIGTPIRHFTKSKEKVKKRANPDGETRNVCLQKTTSRDMFVKPKEYRGGRIEGATRRAP